LLSIFVSTALRSQMDITFAYFWAGLAAIIPTIYVIFRHPGLAPKLAILSFVFLIIWFFSQYFAVSYGYWGYTNGGHYLGWIQFLTVKYPIEELLFWMLLYSPSIVAYYEVTMDDGV
jgi:hypothetical protein